MGKIKVSKLQYSRRTLALGAALVVVAVFGFIIWRSNHSKAPSAVVVPKGPEAPQKTVTSSNSSPKSSSSTSSNTQSSLPTDQSRVNVSLSAPSGQLSGTQAPPAGSTAAITQAAASLGATCLTLADATCVVELTNPSGSVTTINPSSNDGQGNFVFNWSGTGYATGTWQVALVATKNGASAQSNIGPLAVLP